MRALFLGAGDCLHSVGLGMLLSGILLKASMVMVISGSNSELSTEPGLLVSGSDRPLGMSVVVDTLLLA